MAGGNKHGQIQNGLLSLFLNDVFFEKVGNDVFLALKGFSGHLTDDLSAE